VVFKFIKRNSLKKQPLDDRCNAFLERELPLWEKLKPDARKKLSGDLQILAEEKSFEGCGGLELTDEMIWLICAQAGLLLQGEASDYYPNLDSVLVYPTRYVAPVEEYYEGGIVGSGEEVRSGESWQGGVLVLAWDEIRPGKRRKHQHYNLVLHEFAHQVDDDLGIYRRVEAWLETGEDDGMEWVSKFGKSYQQFLKNIRFNRPVFFDTYGAENPAEFFAVVTEMFIMNPREFVRRDAELFGLMKEAYNFNPLDIFEPGNE